MPHTTYLIKDYLIGPKINDRLAFIEPGNEARISDISLDCMFKDMNFSKCMVKKHY